METNKFDFGEALSYIKIGETVQCTINGITRRYFLKDGEIVCRPNITENLTYKVKKFYIDSIMSNNWELVYA